MAPHPTLRRAGSFVLATGLAISLLAFPASLSAAEETSSPDVSAELLPGADGASDRAAATVFTINDVLAKLDGKRGRANPDGVRLAALTPANVATDLPPPHPESLSSGSEPFGLFKFRAPDGLLWRKWHGVEEAMRKEKAVLEQCRADAASCPGYAAQFLRLVAAVKSKAGRARLEEANRAVNQAIRYVSDLSQHGELDRWNPPLASFATAKGDCEDYAIAKMAALTEAGVSADDLQLVLVRDRAVRQDHAVLAARHDGHWLILDNRWSELTEDTEATRFTPMFAINRDGVHLFATPFAGRSGGKQPGEATPAARGASPPAPAAVEAKQGTNAAGFGTLPLLL
jgi:predicted transglutaminase-like cysteine proteinase